MNKSHVLCPKNCAFKVTLYLQSIICLLGQHSVFSSASDLLLRLLRLEISGKQIQRISEWYGSQIDPIIEANHTEYMIPMTEPKDKEITYVMMDGSMLYTREDEWKEMKLGRIFNESQNIEIQSDRNEIIKSAYVSHLGAKDQFFLKLERHLSMIKSKKVVIADGAKYIWNWVEDNYPDAKEILDYYHAVEKLADFARKQYIGEEKRKAWLLIQKELLLDNGVEQVIQGLKKLRAKNNQAKEAKEIAIRYYIEHADRMMYKTYREEGLLIGSGPIEAAHRNVIQQRLKLSGQKWSIQGANAIANLRCYQQSGAWDTMDNLIRLAA